MPVSRKRFVRASDIEVQLVKIDFGRSLRVLAPAGNASSSAPSRDGQFRRAIQTGKLLLDGRCLDR